MNYSKDIITVFGELIDDEKTSFDKLKVLGYPELIMLNYALSGVNKAFKWLEENKHVVLFAFAHAVYEDDKKAIEFLIKNKAPHWAAVAQVVAKSEKAKEWLTRYQLEHYIKLAEKIQEKITRESPSDFEVFFRPIS